VSDYNMSANYGPSKTTGLRKGDASKIARRCKVSVQHVVEVASGNRPGRAALVKLIDAYRRRAAQEAPKS
jgi:hypothetical protein